MTGQVQSLDDEEFRSRSLQGIYPQSLLMPTVRVEHVPEGISSISSIAPAAEKVATPLHRPKLPDPDMNIMGKIIAAHMETERLANKGAMVFDAEMTRSLADIRKLEEERRKAFEIEVQELQVRNTWSTLSTVAQYVASISTIALGMATGGAGSALLLATGAIGLSLRVLEDTHILQSAIAWYTKSKELEQKIINNIEMGSFCLQMGLGLAGGAWAWQAGAMAAARSATAIDMTQKMARIVNTASLIGSKAASLGVNVHEKKRADLHADMKVIDAQITSNNQTMIQESKNINQMIESAQSQTDEIRKAIQALEVSTD